MPTCPYRAAQHAIQALDGVGGVNHFSDFPGICVERNDVRPMAVPGGPDGGEFLAPGTVLEFLECHGSGFGVLGLVDALELLGDRFAILPGTKIQGITNQMHNAGLDLRLGKYRIDRLRKAFQSVHNGDQDIVHSAVLDLRHHGVDPTVVSPSAIWPNPNCPVTSNQPPPLEHFDCLSAKCPLLTGRARRLRSSLVSSSASPTPHALP